MKTISTVISEENLKLVDDYCEKNGLSRSYWIKAAILNQCRVDHIQYKKEEKKDE